MSNERFEGSWLGGMDQLDDKASMECGICWAVYDPALGDPAAKIPPGTAFTALPEGWHCPACDAPRDKFMVLVAGSARRREVATVDQAAQLKARVLALENAFRQRDSRMRDLPVYNGLLRIEAVGARVYGDDVACVLISPWFMNIMLFPLDPAGAPVLVDGSKRMRQFPSGEYETIAGRIDGLGAFEVISLYSPVFEFADQAVARATAASAAEGLFVEPEGAPPPAPRPLSRRELMFGARD